MQDKTANCKVRILFVTQESRIFLCTLTCKEKHRGKSGEDLNDIPKKILEILSMDAKFTAAKLAQQVGVSGRNVEDKWNEVVLHDAKLIALTGTNYFAVKKLLGVEDTIGNYVVHCPLSAEGTPRQ